MADDAIDLKVVENLDDKQLMILLITALNSQGKKLDGMHNKVDNFLKLSESKLSREEHLAEQKRRYEWERSTEDRIREIESSRKYANPERNLERIILLENIHENKENNKQFFLGITSGTWKVIAAIIAVAGFIVALTS